MLHRKKQMKEKKRLNNQKVESMISCAKEKKLLVAYEIAKNDMTVTSDSVKKLWIEWYPEDEDYFNRLPYKWNDCYNWISKFIEKYPANKIPKYIMHQRTRQKKQLNKKCKFAYESDAYVIMVKSKIKGNHLAKYLLMHDSLRRYGDYGSLVVYLKSQKVNPKINGKNENNIPLNIVEKE